ADAAGSPLAEPLRLALADGRGLFALGLRVPDLAAALAILAARGVHARQFSGSGETTAMAWLSLADRAGADLMLTQAGQPGTTPPAHTFPLQRLDHLAAVTPDLDEKTRFWAEVLGVPVAGEVVTPTTVIRQLRFWDAVLELLGPASPDSPLWQ